MKISKRNKNNGVSSRRTAKHLREVIQELELHQVELEAQNQELREARHQVEVSRDSYAALYDSAPVSYITFNKRGVVLGANLTTTQMLKCNRNTIVGLPFSSFVSKTSVATYFKHLRLCSMSDMEVLSEIELRALDNTSIVTELRSIAVFDSELNALVYRTTIADISERKKNEERQLFLLETAETFSQTLDYYSTLQHIANQSVPFLADFCIVSQSTSEQSIGNISIHHRDAAKDSWLKELQYDYLINLHSSTSLNEVLSSGLSHLYPKIDSDELLAIATGPKHFQLLKNCNLHSLMYVPLKSKDRSLGVMTLGISESEKAFNLSDLKFAEEYAYLASAALEKAMLYKKLKRAKEKAEDANHSKSMFLANMSHELRTPLGAMLGFAERLLHENKDASYGIHAATVIQKNGQQLLRLIDDILDLSKIEAEKLVVEIADFDFVPFLQNIFDTLKTAADSKNVQLHFRCRGEIPARIRSDDTRLRQILLNVVGNAIKFTNQGKVEVSIRISKTHKNQIEFIVKDSGIGLSAEEQKKIFKPFTQADGSVSRQYGGTGLGLVLSRKLATSLGGGLDLLNSFTGKGSTFQIRVDSGCLLGVPLVKSLKKLQQQNKSKVQDQNSESGSRALSHKRILVIEDSLDNQDLFSETLSSAGATVDLASDGIEGMHMALASQYDLLLMDIQMPRCDGYEATHLLRQQGYTCPIVALTAHAMKEEQAKCLASGFNGYLTKPISPQKLVEEVRLRS